MASQVDLVCYEQLDELIPALRELTDSEKHVFSELVSENDEFKQSQIFDDEQQRYCSDLIAENEKLKRSIEEISSELEKYRANGRVMEKRIVNSKICAQQSDRIINELIAEKELLLGRIQRMIQPQLVSRN